MFEIEYKLTLQDELNAIDADKEYILNLPFLSRRNIQNTNIMALVIFILTLPNIYKCFTSNVPFFTNLESPDTSIVGIILNLLFVFLLIPQISVRLPTEKLVQKYNVRKSLKNNPNLVKPRKIIVTETKFIFIREKEEKSWFWAKLTNYFENDTGFILNFGSEIDRRFIPKHIFTHQEQMNEFKAILVKHKN
ncbi:MAG: hypothetical protein ACRC1Z_25700 [Waterburya sp.]